MDNFANNIVIEKFKQLEQYLRDCVSEVYGKPISEVTEEEINLFFETYELVEDPNRNYYIRRKMGGFFNA